MAGLIPQDFIADLIERVSLSDVIGSRITLKKSGSSLTACCPFHQEKTPSFHVNTQKNFYHCFGCGVNGNSINFLREYDNLNFNEAVEELAKIAGVEIPRDEAVKKVYSLQNKMWDALEYSNVCYREALKNHPSKSIALQYLTKRGLTEDVIAQFSIGFAPAEADFLSSKASPAVLKSLIEARAVSDKGTKLYDLFQNRLMFPIRNSRGKTIAFGGRTLGSDKAKYINSPESEVFHKSHELYGLFEANQANRRLERLLIVEGYMDVVALAQYGITYAVATLGTATNTDNLTQMLRRCQNLVFCFDGDNAGINAARKAMENSLSLYEDGMQLSFLILPQGEDPDTLVRAEGKDAFERRIDQAKPLSEFIFDIYAADLNLNIAEHKGLLKERIEPQLKKINSAVFKSALRQRLNQLSFRWQKHDDKKMPGTTELTGDRMMLDPDVSLCLAMYYEPSLSADILLAVDGVDHYTNAIDFAGFLTSESIRNTQDLVGFLALDQSGYCARFSHIFDRLEWVPNAEEAKQAANDLLLRVKREKNQAQALKVTKIFKSPSQMSEEEKQALRSISVTKSKE
jgi:DNA primase